MENQNGQKNTPNQSIETFHGCFVFIKKFEKKKLLKSLQFKSTIQF